MTRVAVRDISFNYGALNVLDNLSIDIKEGEFVVLLGPSGCGKSTLLNCIAGLLDVSAGQIFINGRNVTWAEPGERAIGMVFQSYALYPQMSVERNLSFGLKNAGIAPEEIKQRVEKVASLLKINDLLDRKPAALSGGQMQRVGIGRALVRDVDLFLFDEPLSNLDAKLRAELRVEIKRLHQKTRNTMIYVTHDQIEALTLADRVVIMHEGVIQQIDAPMTIYNEPANLFVAGFVGSPEMNFFDGEVVQQDEETWFVTGKKRISLRKCPAAAGIADRQPVVLGLRPEHVIVRQPESVDEIDQENCAFDATVDYDEPMGAENLTWFNVSKGMRISATINAADRMEHGMKALVELELQYISLFDKATGNRI